MKIDNVLSKPFISLSLALGVTDAIFSMPTAHDSKWLKYQ